eukprot:TRINITY_DN9726_c0_g1_i4.p2 TRINITY_DN9726_c0_g1~~TRINITY_DN9726_c0_g1_i4.p2  ORF type:complete len:118 (+),score=34.28 TRINITY_DN9726_c0_g1_i4:111-464(+)
MQGEKKGGAGSKGAWGKLGDEYTKSIPQSDLDDEELVKDQERYKKFKEQIEAKLKADKFAADELEPFTRKDLPLYLPMKSLFALRKPDLIQYLKERESVAVECRPLIAEVYQDSKFE